MHLSFPIPTPYESETAREWRARAKRAAPNRDPVTYVSPTLLEPKRAPFHYTSAERGYPQVYPDHICGLLIRGFLPTTAFFSLSLLSFDVHTGVRGLRWKKELPRTLRTRGRN